MSGDIGDFRGLLAKVGNGEPLGIDEAERAFDIMTNGDSTPAQMGAFLMGLKVRGAHEDYIRERVGRDIALDTTVQEFTDGRIIAYTVRPLPDGGGIATHEDVTEREELNARLKRQYDLGKQQEEALRIRNFQFDTAINNMSQGLCFFDADHKLIVCNERFLELYDIPASKVGPGTKLIQNVTVTGRTTFARLSTVCLPDSLGACMSAAVLPFFFSSSVGSGT